MALNEFQEEQVQDQEPPVQQPPAVKLYKTLIGDGYSPAELGSEQDFVNKIKDSARASKLYDVLINDGYSEKEIRTKNEFLNAFVEKKKIGAEPSPSLATGSPYVGTLPPGTPPTPKLTKQQGIDLDKALRADAERAIAAQKPQKFIDYTPPEDVLKAQRKTVARDLNAAVRLDKEQSGTRAGYVWNQFLKGVGGVSSAASDVVMQVLTNVLPKEALGGTKEEVIKQWREQAEPTIREATAQIVGSDVGLSKQAKYEKEFWTSALGGVAQTVPMMLGTKGSGLLLGSYDMGLQMIENTEEGKKLPESHKSIFAAGVGLANAALEKAGMDRIFGKQSTKVAYNMAMKTMNDLIEKSSAPITVEAFEKALGVAAKTLKEKTVKAGGKLGEAAAVEFITGGAQEISNIAAEKAINAAEKKQIFTTEDWASRVKDAAAAEGAGGLIFGALGLPFSKTRNYIAEKVIESKSDADLDNLRAEIAQNVPADQQENAMALVNQYAIINKKIPADVQNRREVAEAISERDELEAKIKQKEEELGTIDVAFRQEAEDEIKVLKAKYDELNQKAIEESKKAPEDKFEMDEGVLEPGDIIKNKEGKLGRVVEIRDGSLVMADPTNPANQFEWSKDDVEGEIVTGTPKVEAVEQEVVVKEMAPITDEMVKIEREFQNQGYTIDWDYDNEIQIRDKNGEIVGPEDLPDNLKDFASKYEQATSKLGDYDQGALMQALEKSRKVEEVKAEEVKPKEIKQYEGIVKESQISEEELRDILVENKDYFDLIKNKQVGVQSVRFGMEEGIRFMDTFDKNGEFVQRYYVSDNKLSIKKPKPQPKKIEGAKEEEYKIVENDEGGFVILDKEGYDATGEAFDTYEEAKRVAEASKFEPEGKPKEITLYHGGRMDSKGNIFLTPDKNIAKEYASINKGDVIKISIDENKVINEDEVREIINSLNLTNKEGETNFDDLLLHELLDPRFESSLEAKDIKKVKEIIKNKGYNAISYIDEDITGKSKTGTQSYLLLEKPKESIEPKKEKKEGEAITLNLADKGKAEGVKIAIPGFENMDLVAVREGFNYNIYEATTGMQVAATSAFDLESAKSQIRDALLSKNVSPEKIFEAIIKGKLKQINESPAFTQYKAIKEDKESKKPFKYSEEEREEFIKLSEEAKKKGLESLAKTIESAANAKEDAKWAMSLEDAKRMLKESEKRQTIEQIKKENKPLPDKDKKILDDSEEEFARIINSEYEKDKYSTIPEEIRKKAYEAYKKMIAIHNKYGYYPKSIVEGFPTIGKSPAPDIALAWYIKAVNAKKIETRPARIKEAIEKLNQSAAKLDDLYDEEIGQPKPKLSKEKETIQEAFNDYEEEGKEYKTVGDLVDLIESLDIDELADAVKTFREEQEYDRELAGRGDMESAEENMLDAIKGYISTKAVEKEIAEISKPPAGALKSEESGERLSNFSKGDIVYRNYEGRYEEYEIIDDKKSVWKLKDTRTDAIKEFNADSNEGFILKNLKPASEFKTGDIIVDNKTGIRYEVIGPDGKTHTKLKNLSDTAIPGKIESWSNNQNIFRLEEETAEEIGAPISITEEYLRSLNSEQLDDLIKQLEEKYTEILYSPEVGKEKKITADEIIGKIIDIQQETLGSEVAEKLANEEALNSKEKTYYTNNKKSVDAKAEEIKSIKSYVGKTIKIGEETYSVAEVRGPFKVKEGRSYGNFKDVNEYYQIIEGEGEKRRVANVFLNKNGEWESLYVNDNSIIQPAELKTQLPTRQKPFITKSGRQFVVVNPKTGLAEVFTKSGEKVSRATEKKALREYAQSLDYKKGLTADESGNKVESKSEAIEASENPYELVELYVTEEPTTQSLSSVEAMIADYGIGKTTNQSFRRFNDINNITLTLARNYLDNKNGFPLDVIAKSMSDHYDYEITPEDVAAFMVRFPKADYGKIMETEDAMNAAAKFEKLTGLKLNREIADIVLNQAFVKAAEDQRAIEQLQEKEFASQAELEQEYNMLFGETNGFEPGKYKLSDGTEVIVNEDGTIKSEKYEPPTEVKRPSKKGPISETGRKIETEKEASQKQAGKDAANKIRNLKIDLGKLGEGGAQSNIFGIPIAVYNAAVETIAKLIEAGATLTDAINQAIKKHKLAKEKEWQRREFIKAMEEAVGESYEENIKEIFKDMDGINQLRTVRQRGDAKTEIKSKYGTENFEKASDINRKFDIYVEMLKKKGVIVNIKC